jgi:hypothetical protein
MLGNSSNNCSYPLLRLFWRLLVAKRSWKAQRLQLPHQQQ